MAYINIFSRSVGKFTLKTHARVIENKHQSVPAVLFVSSSFSFRLRSQYFPSEVNLNLL